jgi:hypothetical protein
MNTDRSIFDAVLPKYLVNCRRLFIATAYVRSEGARGEREMGPLHCKCCSELWNVLGPQNNDEYHQVTDR